MRERGSCGEGAIAGASQVEGALQESVLQGFWEQSVYHPEGAGLSHEGGVAAFKASANHFRKLEMHQEAGVIEAAASAAIWTCQTRHQAGMPTRSISL